METGERPTGEQRDFWVGCALSLVVFLAFYFSTKAVQQHFDYTSRIASALLHGRLGLPSPPPSWLNEMVPRDGSYYSVFPLGAVLSVIPVALLQAAGVGPRFSGTGAGSIDRSIMHVVLFSSCPASKADRWPRRILLALFPIFGTWVWCNLGFGGAWHIALGFALLGEIGALFFILVRPRPLLAGAFFALAFGNRTELILSLPVCVYLLARPISSAARPGKI